MGYLEKIQSSKSKEIIYTKQNPIDSVESIGFIFCNKPTNGDGDGGDDANAREARAHTLFPRSAHPWIHIQP